MNATSRIYKEQSNACAYKSRCTGFIHGDGHMDKLMPGAPVDISYHDAHAKRQCLWISCIFGPAHV